MPFDTLAFLYQFLALSWWFWLFIFLLPVFTSTWLFWRQEVYKENTIWTLLELKMPREVRKDPRAMEQVLFSIHHLMNAPSDPAEKWWDGEITNWYSLEVVSLGGEIHFYMRLPQARRHLVEAALLSYYPDVELEEVEDYVNRFPSDVWEMNDQGYDIWATEMILKRESAYPIKTYVNFESAEETKEYDPMSALLEVLAKVKKEEIVGLQILIYPIDNSWRNKYDGLVEKLKNAEKGKSSKGGLRTAAAFPGGPLPHLSTVGGKTETMQFSKSFLRTPGETEVLKAVENNLSKPAFKTQIRLVYFSPVSIFSDTFPRRGIFAAFGQYTALDLNSIVHNLKIWTRVKGWFFPFVFPKLREKYRAQRLLQNYKNREIVQQTFMGKVLTSSILNFNFYYKNFEMNTECLATLFHPPTYIVLTAPHVERVTSRKAGPPAGLAIYGGEEDIEKFK